jgi:Conserved hypothetical protein 95
MQFADLNIDEEELCCVVNAALTRVTPNYAAAKLESCSATELHTPDGSSLTAVLLHVATRSGMAARGQYLPMTGSHDRGFVDEYLFGAIHGHWLAAHGRDLFHEVRLVVDVCDSHDAPRLYRYVDIDEARAQQLIPHSSPIAATLTRYNLRRLLQVGDCLGGPSPGMVELIASETERLGRPRFLDLFAGSCTLARVALEHGAQRAICLDSMLDEQVAMENLGRFAPQAELRRSELASGLDDESYDLVAIDPFYDHTLIAIEECMQQLDGRFQSVVINLGLALPTTWQMRIRKAIESRMDGTQIYERYGERIAVCEPQV